MQDKLLFSGLGRKLRAFGPRAPQGRKRLLLEEKLSKIFDF